MRAGRKTATCDRIESFGEPWPEPGRRDIALDWDGDPFLVIETLTVQCIRDCDVGAALALAEGENHDLAGWREDHRRYLERTGGWRPGSATGRRRPLEGLAEGLWKGGPGRTRAEDQGRVATAA